MGGSDGEVVVVLVVVVVVALSGPGSEHGGANLQAMRPNKHGMKPCDLPHGATGMGWT